MKKPLLTILLISLYSLVVQAQKIKQQLPQQKRLALVIGIKEYEFAGKLKNTINDAEDMAAVLKKVGFEVMMYHDLDYRGFMAAIRSFAEKAPAYDILLFYYSGHGIMHEGDNYLVPTDASILNSEEQIAEECINIRRVTSNFNKVEGKANIAIVDACRNYPFSNRSWLKGKRDLGFSNQFRLPSVSGSIVAQSTGEGETSDDNLNGRNGLYTAALLKHIQKPGLTVPEVFQLARKDVKEQSKGKQNPIDYNELVGNLYFIPNEKNSSTTKTQKKSDQVDSDEDGIVDSKDKCPNQKGELKNDGCPIKVTPTYTLNKINEPVKQENTQTSNDPVQKPLKNSSKPQSLKLQEGTPIRLVLLEDITSKTAASGDAVELEVKEDVVIAGYIVIQAGTHVRGEILDVERSKMFGHPGKLEFAASYAISVDEQNIRIRSLKKYEGQDKSIESTFLSPLMKGKDARVSKGTVLTGYIDNTYEIKTSLFK